MYGGDEWHAVTHDIRYFLDSIVVPLIAVEFLSQEIESVKKFRGTIYSKLKKKRVKSSNLRRELILYSDLQREIRKTDRFLLEFDQAEKFIQHKFGESHPEKMFEMNKFSSRKLPPEKFRENVFSRISYLRNIFDKHMSFLNKSFSTYVEFLNVEAIYRLQIVSIALSVLALVAAVIGVLSNWESIARFIK
jgi:hypothetical protein